MFAKFFTVAGVVVSLAFGTAAATGCSGKKDDGAIALEDPAPADERAKDDPNKSDAEGDSTDKPDGKSALTIAEKAALKRAKALRPGATAPETEGARTEPVTKRAPTRPRSGVKNLAVKAPPAIGDHVKLPAAATEPTPEPAAVPTPDVEANATPTPTTPPEPKLAGTAPPTAAEPDPTPERPAPKLANPTPRVSTFPLDPYLDITKVRTVTGNRALRPSGPIAGVAPNPTYNSVVYDTTGSKGFGVALQVWRDASRQETQRRFKRMQQQYPNAEETKALAPSDAFFSYWGEVQTLTMFDDKKRTVASVSCGEALCTQKALFELAKHVQSKL